MRLILAPMEGLTDPPMRRLLTQVGQYDWCVSEFIRVTNQLVPAHVIYGYCPELLQGGRTDNGTPLHVQFLGNDPVALAENAAHAAALGAPAIDLNFGCPAKTVNKHRGGAVLLDETELIYQIVSAVRRAVPAQIPVSAKMRLGYLDNTPALANALAIEAAGAAWLTVHARTKADAYRPPAYWDLLAPLREQGVLIVGSGMSFHNMRAFFSSDPAIRGRSEAFDLWLNETLSGEALAATEREQRLTHWADAPQGRFCHPREEHLLPLLVCFGAASHSGKPARQNFSGLLFNTAISGYVWR